MVLLNSDETRWPKLFIVAGLILLGTGLLWGLLGGLQYLIPGFLKPGLSFEKIRPLHVSSVVFWIIFGAMGAVLSYLQQYLGTQIRLQALLKIQFLVFSLSAISILISYCFGIFGGREYWEFNPWLALPIVFGWILFLIIFIISIGSFKKQPVYVWMWLTGIAFFLFTFLESYLWIFPYFRNNVVNDMTIQWKSNGSMVGSWNMLIYGSSIFLMEKISGNKSYGHSAIAFALYFTGLFNLMFNWGHHIYTLPTHNYIKHISYIISMTELILIGRIIYQWRSSLNLARKHFHHAAYMFLAASEVWIFLSLFLAILMSIPGINVYTHGTHLTVAHTMGATIGINTFILLAIASDIHQDHYDPTQRDRKVLSIAFWTINVALFIFWISLIIAGIIKARWQMSVDRIPFNSMMLHLRPMFILFFIAGLGLMAGFMVIIYPLIKHLLRQSGKTIVSR